jgi:hypothetical protein
MKNQYSEDFDEILDTDKIMSYTESFKNSKPFRHAYIQRIFKKDFYDKLYETFPKYDNTWFVNNDYRRSARTRSFYSKEDNEPTYDHNLSSEWNKMKQFICSQQFLDIFSKFLGIKFSTVYESGFFANKKGDFQLPHIDEEGEYQFKIQCMFYFSKRWQKGDPGGTYLCKSDDEESLFFEPYDLDNSMVCFEETPDSWHGTRYITKDVTRQAFSISLK